MASDARIGVFGGSFDPVHVGHLIIADIMRHVLRLERVLFLPAGQPPHKPDRLLAPDTDRLRMLTRSIAGTPYFEVDTLDIDRGGASYTAESLQLLRDRFGPSVEMYFLMGQDSLRDFPTWHHPHQIVRLARLGVALRPGIVPAVEPVIKAVPEAAGRIEMVDVPLIGISSSDIRDRVRRGLPYRYQVLPEVADLIAESRLYLTPDEAVANPAARQRG